MSHAITPTDRGRRPPLTRSSDVLLVLRTGGTVQRVPDTGLLSLFDRDGNSVAAWQQAIKSAQQRMEVSA